MKGCQELPGMVKIHAIKDECSEIKTFFLDTKLEAKPGQFVMVWVPGVDEKPFSLSYIQKRVGITVQRRGKFTKRMFELKAGDRVGIRGPYGKGFEVKENACVVAGGCGLAALAPLIEMLNCPSVIIGARHKGLLFFAKRFEGATFCTDDGSHGTKGFTTNLLEKKVAEHRFGTIYTCGPEIMMKKVYEVAKREGIECYASLERYMRCGFGVCGACACSLKLVCMDGPVFRSDELAQMSDFGSKAILKSGKSVALKEYVEHKC